MYKYIHTNKRLNRRKYNIDNHCNHQCMKKIKINKNNNN